MKIYCVTIARNHAYSTLRKAGRREKLGHAGICERDANEYTPLEYGAPEQRDPGDTLRQLEVAAQLFRDGRMPKHGVAILHGVMRGWTYRQIGRSLGVTADTIEGRMRMMRTRCRERMTELGMLPRMQPLEVIVSTPTAIETLRKAA